jgi:hypothetical protein
MESPSTDTAAPDATASNKSDGVSSAQVEGGREAAAPDGRPSLAAIVLDSQLSGFMQVDYLRRDISIDELSQDGREPLNEDGFLFRHARLRLDRDWTWVGMSAETEFFADGNTARPVAFDVHAQMPGERGKPPVVQFRAGLFPIPFGYENFNQSDYQRFFGERTLFVQGFVPGRFDLGAALSGHLWNVDWIVAVQNGQPLGAPDFAYSDPNSAKDFAGRVRVSGEILPRLNAAVAVSVLAGEGFSPGTPATKDSFEWRDLDEDGRVLPSELIPIAGSAARASENFDRWGMGSDIQLWTQIPRLGELMVYGEAAVAVNLDRAIAPADPVTLGRDQRGLGFYMAATQEVTEYSTVGVRYEQYEPNVDELEMFDGRTVVTRRRFRMVTAGISGNLKISNYTRARVLAEYEYQRNSLGRDERGRPDHLDNNTLRVRFEVAF